jgi:hypothetical protein
LLIFSLIHAELKWIMLYLEEQYLRREHPDNNFSELIEGVKYSLSMELKKVMHRELLGAAALRQYDLIFAKIQNSQGILMNSVQQIVFSIAHYFDPRLEGHEIFPDYVTRLDQSIKLRADIYELRLFIGRILREGDLMELAAIIRKIEWFRMGSMKCLMYKDWFDFDNFYREIQGCRTSGNLNFSLHRFYTFLTTLIKEVNKRAILSNYPLDKPL